MLGELVSARGAVALQYGSGQGDPRLRELICQVMALEGVHASPEDVVVTVGSQQGLDLVTRVFCDPGDVVVAEAPSYVGALGTFAAYQARVVQVPMDSDGLRTDALRETLGRLDRAGQRPKFVYTIPNFHNPAGVSLTAERRQALLRVADEYDLLLVEDNPYGLLGFEQEPTPALRAGEADRVVYLGSFSKTFAPGLRVGWVCAPHGTRERLVLASEAAVLCPPTFNQLAVAEYLASQPWQQQVKVFCEIYRDRRDALLGAMEQLLPAGCGWNRPQGGFYVWLDLPAAVDAKAMLPRAVQGRVAYVPGTAFYADGGGSSQLRLSYCYPPPEVIEEGVRRLAVVLEHELELYRTFSGGSGE
jgi:DNA-binding transcriptional MocR family regulator